MTLQTGLGVTVQPLQERTYQSGVALPSKQVLALSHETEALWMSSAGNRHSYTFLTPDVAPQINSTGVSTMTAFAFTTGGDLEIPWHHQVGHDAIELIVIVAVEDRTVDTYLSAQTVTLINAVTTTSSETVFMEDPGRPPIRGPWSRGARVYHMRPTMVRIVSPNLAADRRVAIKIRGQFSAPNNWTNISITRHMAIRSISIRDVKYPPTPGQTA